NRAKQSYALLPGRPCGYVLLSHSQPLRTQLQYLGRQPGVAKRLRYGPGLVVDCPRMVRLLTGQYVPQSCQSAGEQPVVDRIKRTCNRNHLLEGGAIGLCVAQCPENDDGREQSVGTNAGALCGFWMRQQFDKRCLSFMNGSTQLP